MKVTIIIITRMLSQCLLMPVIPQVALWGSQVRVNESRPFFGIKIREIIYSSPDLDAISCALF